MNHKTEAFIYTLLHFLVDLTTVFLISGVLLGPTVGIVNRGLVIIAYNLIAFAGQLPIGMIADVVGKNRLITAIGCLCACIAYPVAFISPWIACVLAALGNGAFHIGAGSSILKMSMPKSGLSGLFVSSGAFGVWLAYKLNERIAILLLPAIMLFVAVFLISIKNTEKKESVEIRYKKPDFLVLSAVSCFMLTIVIRSLLGMVMNFSWKAIPIYSFLFVFSVALGKAIGGFLCDRLGHIKTAILSLTVSLIAFIFSFNLPVLGIVAVFCFNMTMPLTLTAIAGVSHNKYGFAFGLTTFALAVGFLPVAFGADSWFGAPMLLSGVLLSLIFLVLGYVLLEKQSSKEQKANDLDIENSSI